MASRESGELYLADLDLGAEDRDTGEASVDDIRRPLTRDALELDFEDDEAPADGEIDTPRRAAHSFDALPPQAFPAVHAVEDDELHMHGSPGDSTSRLPPGEPPGNAEGAGETADTRDTSGTGDTADPGRKSVGGRDRAGAEPGRSPRTEMPQVDGTEEFSGSREFGGGEEEAISSGASPASPQGAGKGSPRPAPEEPPATILYKTSSPAAETRDVAEDDILQALNGEVMPFFDPPSAPLPEDGFGDFPSDLSAELPDALPDDRPVDLPGASADLPVDSKPDSKPDSRTGTGATRDELDVPDATFDSSVHLPEPAIDTRGSVADTPLPEGIPDDGFSWGGIPEDGDAGNPEADSPAHPSRMEEDDDFDAELDVRELQTMPWGYPHGESDAGTGAGTGAEESREKRRESSDSDLFVQGFFQTLAADLPEEPGRKIRAPHSADGLTLDAIEEEDILASLAPFPLPPPISRRSPGTPEDQAGMEPLSRPGRDHPENFAAGSPFSSRTTDAPDSPAATPQREPSQEEPGEDELHDLIHAMGLGEDGETTAFSPPLSEGRPVSGADQTVLEDRNRASGISESDGIGEPQEGNDEVDPDSGDRSGSMDMEEPLVDLKDFDPLPPAPREADSEDDEEDAWRSGTDLPRLQESDFPESAGDITAEEDLPEALLDDIPLPGTLEDPGALPTPEEEVGEGGDAQPTPPEPEGGGRLLDRLKSLGDLGGLLEKLRGRGGLSGLGGTLRERVLQPFLMQAGRLWNWRKAPPAPEPEPESVFDAENFQLGFDVADSVAEPLTGWDTGEAGNPEGDSSTEGGSDWGDTEEDLLDFSVPHATAPGAETVTHLSPLDLPLHPELDGEDEEDEDDILAGPIDIESAFPEAMDESASFKQRLSLFDEFEEDDGSLDEKYDDIDALKTGVGEAVPAQVAAPPSLSWREKWEILRGFLGVAFGGVARKISDTLNLGENWWMYVDAIAILILVISLAVIAASLIWF